MLLMQREKNEPIKFNLLENIIKLVLHDDFLWKRVNSEHFP